MSRYFVTKVSTRF